MKKIIKNLLIKIAVSNLSIQAAIRLVSEQLDNIYFIQIGANDGVSHEAWHHLKKSNNWTGILIEPQTKLIEQLRKNYPEPNFKVLNKAFDYHTGIKKLYSLNISEDSWATGLATFNLEVLLKHFDNDFIIKMAKEKCGIEIKKDGNYEEYISTEDVETISYNEIQDINEQINIIFIDVEGYDFEILKMIDLTRLDIRLIIFENKHLGQNDFEDAVKYLKKHSFWIKHEGENTLAIRTVSVPLQITI